MAVDSKHPDYTDRLEEWQLMRHANRGPIEVYRQGILYLPIPSGFTTQPDQGLAWYDAYKKRARFPDVIAPTLRGMVGLIHRTDADIEMPTAMEPIWERATRTGLPLESFHRRITGELLLTGRYGVLTDASEEGSDVPFLSGYNAEAIINWTDEQDFFVLDESGPVRDGFNWKNARKFRLVELVDGVYVMKVYDNLADANGTGSTQGQPVNGQTPEKTDEDGGREVPVSKRGNGTLDKVPFVIASASDLSAAPKEIPLLGVARAAIALYQLDADYRHQLYMSGQETFVTIGLEKQVGIVGAGVSINLPIDGDAKYVGPAGTGMAAHRQAIIDAREDAVTAGAQLFDVQSGQESGEALRLRYAAQTATLTTIAQTSASALEQALKNVAIFMGLDPDKVTVKPNLRFVDTVMTPTEATQLMKLWMGEAISKLTMYENLQRGEIASPERDFEEEQALIAQDAIDRPQPLALIGVPPTDPNNPNPPKNVPVPPKPPATKPVPVKNKNTPPTQTN